MRFRAAAAVALLSSHTAMTQQPARPSPNHAIERANLDTTCAACSDFYTFANGGWLKHNTVPAAYGTWGSFNELQDKNEAVIHKVIDTSLATVRNGTAKRGADVYKLGAYYDACLDTLAIDALGTKPIDATMARIAKIASTAELPAALARLEASDGLAPFGIGPGADLKNSNRYIVNASQGGLSIGPRDYYVSQDTAMQKVRAAFVDHAKKLFMLYGESDADAATHAKTVLAIETKFAEASMDQVSLRNPSAVYHVMSLAAFDSLAPALHWQAFITAQGGPTVTEVNVNQPDFFRAMNGFLTSIPLDDWKTLLRFRLLNAAAPSLPKPWVDENFAFFKLFSGQRERLPRGRFCTQRTAGVLGDAVGQEFVKQTFSPEAKARAKAIVETMVSSLQARMSTLDWMSDSTKREAAVKLAAFGRKIGYPDRWRDYSKLGITRGEYLLNQRRVSSWQRAINWAKLAKPVDKTEWLITVDQVNAGYTPLWNDITFPAGILQPPFFDPNADDAVNYGAMGAVIGHEMSHGFDDQGRRFDAKGNLRDWWAKSDADQYAAQAQRVVDQFNAYTVVDSTTHVNGKLTLGENIGDLGGLKIAYLAMESSMAKKGRQPPIDGFTPEQRFFLGWAQVWRELQTDNAAKAQVNTNVHAPAKWRVNGPLSNMPEFKAAWGCKEGDAMVRPESLRARIW
jgi:putative endopeptidase